MAMKATPEYLASVNPGQNVLLGAASEGLCFIDIDNDNQLEAFLRLNPGLRESLISRGARNGNVWIRVQGKYPPSGKLVLFDKPWGNGELMAIKRSSMASTSLAVAINIMASVHSKLSSPRSIGWKD
jgi:hypothetical protein